MLGYLLLPSYRPILSLLRGTALLLAATGLHSLLLPLRGQAEGFSTASLGLLETRPRADEHRRVLAFLANNVQFFVCVVLPAMQLKPETQRRIIEIVAGSGAAYSAVNADGPYRGRHGPGHKAYQRYHTGLAFGIAEFGQDSGTLGQLLSLMHDPAKIHLRGHVVWINPDHAAGGRPQGIGVGLQDEPAAADLKKLVEKVLGSALGSSRPTHTL